MSNTTLSASIAICTRNRGDKIVATLKSILACTPPDFEIIVVDQSTNDDTQSAVMRETPDARIRYIRTPTKGISRSRNIAIAEARADVLVYTDDDCIVPPDYVSAFRDIFLKYPRVAVAFCNVKPFPHDPAKGIVPDYIRTGDALLTRLVDRCTARGIGAGMALRRDAMLEIGCFDEMQGLGARFGSAEDVEITLRALMLGWHAYETDRIAVLHDGFRTWQEYKAKSARLDWYAIGSCYAKGLKAGHLDMLALILYELLVRILWSPIRDVRQGRKPAGFLRPVYLMHGIIDGLRTPVDRKHILYR